MESAARDRSDTSWISDETDPLTRALNRSCTRAFETAILFVAAEVRAAQPVRSAFEDLLSFALRLEDSDGAEYRTVLAPRIAWLRHTLPEWTSTNLEGLFGGEAPDSLARLTIDMAIQWSQPNPWLLETYPEMIQDAAGRCVERAMDYLLVGMLWNCSGYQVGSVVGFLESHPTLVSDAGRQLSTLIRGDETERSHVEVADDLWEALLASEAASSLEGFGWMSRVEALDTERWPNSRLPHSARPAAASSGGIRLLTGRCPSRLRKRSSLSSTN